MKENLLITIGDSWTEGLGAYSDAALAQYKQDKDLDRLQQPTDYMRQNSWPTQLAAILDYDLVNFGVRGSANSAHAKWLLNEDKFSQYKKVQVIWLLSEPYRFSFISENNPYSYNGILSISPIGLTNDRMDRGPKMKDFAFTYLQLVEMGDVIAETQFYIQVVENYCQVMNYGLLIGNAFSPVQFTSDYNLHTNQSYNSMREFLEGVDMETGSVVSPVCAHPNALGYKYIAEELARILPLPRSGGTEPNGREAAAQELSVTAVPRTAQTA